MISPAANEFLSGALCMGQIVIGVFFLRFWTRLRDPLFLAFAVAFWLMAAGQTASSLTGWSQDGRAIVYLPRFAAFALIILAILRKNLGRNPGRPDADPADSEPGGA